MDTVEVSVGQLGKETERRTTWQEVKMDMDEIGVENEGQETELRTA